MTCLVVIPARWGSSRLPGKPLAMIAGRPLLARTIDLARRATGRSADLEIVVATDDARVEHLARAEGCDVALTGATLTSGSARALAAAQQRTPTPTAIVNLQGDAPFVPPTAITAVIAALSDGASVATPVAQLDWAALDALRHHKREEPFSGTTCIAADDGDAIWFSKKVIPAIRDEDEMRRNTQLSPVLRHLGLYGYTLEALRRFDASPRSHYEQLEGLEQLRLIELGIPVRTVRIESEAMTAFMDIGGIDTHKDILLAERLIAKHGDPFGR